MDSVTQILLGASVGEAVLGHKVGRKAAGWGALCGTLPDLDVFLPYPDAVAEFTYHRSFSHSLITLALLTPLLVWLIRKIHAGEAAHRAGWYLLVYLAFATHVLLDACTIYGTQILWPLPVPPVTWGSVFIIDPLITVPLLLGVLSILLLRNRPALAYRINAAGLGIALAYLSWSFAAKLHVEGLVRSELARQQYQYSRFVVLAAPFNTILWRILVMSDNQYHVAWYSLLDPDDQLRFRTLPRGDSLLAGLDRHPPVSRLRWFTKGFYKASRQGTDIVMTDLRMGIEGAYVFGFKVAEAGNPHPVPTPPELRSSRPPLSGLGPLWRRLRGDRTVVIAR